MLTEQRLRNIISRIRKIMQILVLDIEVMNFWDRQKVMNAIVDIRCEIMNLEQELDA